MKVAPVCGPWGPALTDGDRLAAKADPARLHQPQNEVSGNTALPAFKPE